MKKILAAMALSLALTLPTYALAESESPDLQITIEQDYEQLDLFAEIFQLIQRRHVDGPTDKAIVDAAIQGMIKSLDKHSGYLTPEDTVRMDQEMSGRYAGIGAGVEWKDEKVLLRQLFDGPAKRMGLKKGDMIFEIEGQPTSEMNLQQAVSKIKGPKGTPVTFKYLRGEEEKTITLVRDDIHIKRAEGKILENNIAYIKLSQFGYGASGQIRSEFNKLRFPIGDEKIFTGMILDLRGNPGGLLNQAINITDLFVDEGKIVEIRRKDPRNIMRFFAEDGHMIPMTMPLVVLINENSASASEIVAGALQDLERATIVGVKSYGKGSVQTIYTLGNGGTLKLTTAKYFTASGRVIHGVGITPDVVVLMPEVEEGSTEPVVDTQLDAAIMLIKHPLLDR